MPVRDTFSYSARGDSVGLDCSSCAHFVGPSSWPDVHRISHCARHQASLAIELSGNGYKQWEWFCCDFSNNGSVFALANTHFESIKESLTSGILYRFYATDGFLREYEISQLPRVAA